MAGKETTSLVWYLYLSRGGKVVVVSVRTNVCGQESEALSAKLFVSELAPAYERGVYSDQW